MKLKRLHPELSKLAAQFVYNKYNGLMTKETRELRVLLTELLRRGRDPKDLIEGLRTGDVKLLTGIAVTNGQAKVSG